MRRSAGLLMLLVAAGGCMSVQSSGGPDPMGGGGCPGCYGRTQAPPTVAGVQGPWGQAVPMAQPYASASPGAEAARAMMSRSVPLDMMQASATAMPGASSEVVQAQGFAPGTCPPGGCPPSMVSPPGGVLSPFGLQGIPGMGSTPMVPMMGGGGPMLPPGATPPSGAVAAGGALAGSNSLRFPTQRTQVRFTRPSGMRVGWYTRGADGKESFSEQPVEVPGRYNFLQGAIYRLKLSNIPGRPGLDVYPTLEVVPARPDTEAFLAHSAVPLDFSDEDFKQVAAGNYIVKVIYLPRPENQDLAGTGPDAIVSTQLEPGADPITEALRRGHILLVIRMGNVDQEATNTPQLGAPAPNAGAMQQGAMAPPAMGMPGMAMGPGPGMMPFPMMGPGGPMVPPNPGMMSGGQMQVPGNAMVPPGAPTMPPNFGMQPGGPGGNPGAVPPGPSPAMLAPAFGGPPVPPGQPPAPGNGGVPVTHLPDPSVLQRVGGMVPPPPGSVLQPGADPGLQRWSSGEAAAQGRERGW